MGRAVSYTVGAKFVNYVLWENEDHRGNLLQWHALFQHGAGKKRIQGGYVSRQHFGS